MINLDPVIEREAFMRTILLDFNPGDVVRLYGSLVYAPGVSPVADRRHAERLVRR